MSKRFGLNSTLQCARVGVPKVLEKRLPTPFPFSFFSFPFLAFGLLRRTLLESNSPSGRVLALQGNLDITCSSRVRAETE